MSLKKTANHLAKCILVMLIVVFFLHLGSCHFLHKQFSPCSFASRNDQLPCPCPQHTIIGVLASLSEISSQTLPDCGKPLLLKQCCKSESSYMLVFADVCSCPSRSSRNSSTFCFGFWNRAHFQETCGKKVVQVFQYQRGVQVQKYSEIFRNIQKPIFKLLRMPDD